MLSTQKFQGLQWGAVVQDVNEKRARLEVHHHRKAWRRCMGGFITDDVLQNLPNGNDNVSDPRAMHWQSSPEGLTQFFSSLLNAGMIKDKGGPERQAHLIARDQAEVFPAWNSPWLGNERSHT